MASTVRPALAGVVLAALTAPAILGCASAPASAAAPLAAADPAVASAATAGGEPLPQVELTGPLMFQLMAAELAVQRGDLGAAYATFLSVARSTRDPRIARRATEVAIAARALPQALEASQLWRELAPSSDEALQATAALLVGNGRYDEALPLLQAQLRANPAVELPQVQRMLARAPDRAAAFALLQQLVAPYLDDRALGAEARLTLALGAHAAGDRDRALRETDAALAQRPDFERAALVAAQLLAQTADGKPSPEGRRVAIDKLLAFVARAPAANEARMTLARLLVADGRYAQARAQFEQVLAADPDHPDALYAAAVLALDGPGPRAAARGYFERYLAFVERNPQSGRDPRPVYLNLARIAEEERDFAGALRWLDRIEDGDQLVAARARKALVLGRMKRFEEAHRVLAETRAGNDDERTQLVVAEAQLLREAQRYRESFELLSAALAQAPENAALLYDTAMAAEKLDRLDVMEQHLRLLMRLKPDDAHAFNALGYTFADRNVRLQEAYELIARALALSPDDAYILDSKGWVYFRMGRLDRAREYLERAWNAKPHAEVGAHYGEVLWMLGQRDSARRIWRESVRLDPDNETLKSTLQRLKVSP